MTKEELAQSVVRVLDGDSSWITYSTKPSGCIAFTVKGLGDVLVRTSKLNAFGKRGSKGMYEAAKEVIYAMEDAGLDYAKNSLPAREIEYDRAAPERLEQFFQSLRLGGINTV